MDSESKAGFSSIPASAGAETLGDARDVLLLDTELIEPGAASAPSGLSQPSQAIPAHAKSDPFIRIAPVQGRATRLAAATADKPRFQPAPVATRAREAEEAPVGMPEVVTGSWHSTISLRAFELEAQLEDALSLAAAARLSEERSNIALYRAISSAYDFSLVAASAPDEFAGVLSKAGIIPQQRAPMTAVVKLVFGPGYDKTRLSEYAAALELAHRRNLPKGGLLDCLLGEPGGLKGVVALERSLRKGKSTEPVHDRTSPRTSIVRALRAMPTRSLGDFAATGDEFALVLVRRMPDGSLACVDLVPRNIALLEKAANEVIEHGHG